MLIRIFCQAKQKPDTPTVSKACLRSTAVTIIFRIRLQSKPFKLIDVILISQLAHFKWPSKLCNSDSNGRSKMQVQRKGQENF